MIRQNFNADWTVEKGDGNSRMNSFLGNAAGKTVHLPYDAMIHEARTPDTKNNAVSHVFTAFQMRICTPVIYCMNSLIHFSPVRVFRFLL